MKRPFNVARLIESENFVPASKVLDQDELDQLSESGRITWGDANRTLVTVERISDELGYVPVTLYDLRSDFLIDLEN